MKVLFAGIVLAAASFLGGCKDADIAQLRSMGSKHKITIYSMSGTAVAVYHSTGNVSESTETHAWYFENVADHKLVEFTGNAIIEQE